MCNEDNMMMRSKALVISLVGKELAEKWWTSENKAFENRTPTYQWEIDPASVYTYLIFYSEGGW